MTTDIHFSITHQLISLIDHVSTADYQAPFSQLASTGLPFNPCTKQHYAGVNTVILWLAGNHHGYQSNKWGTYKQWQGKQAKVKCGEKSTQVVFYKRVAKNSTSRKTDTSEFYNLFRTYRVFNADQVEGYEIETDIPENTIEAHSEIDQFVNLSGAVIEHGGSYASYNNSTDKIHMPHKGLFNTNTHSSQDNYYSTLLHELTHWTGGEKRLGRRVKNASLLNGGQEQYAFEELVAELGCAFLCAQFHIMQSGMAGHAIYLRSWLQALKENKKYLFLAAAQAQRAVDFLNHTASQ